MSKINKDDLEIIYNQYGGTSEEFSHAIDLFIKYIQHTHLGYFSIDIQQQCYYNIFKKIENYNSEKGNIATFVYYLARNEITKFLYNSTKLGDHEIAFDAIHIYNPRVPEIEIMNQVDVASLEFFLKNFEKISFLVPDDSIVPRLFLLPSSHPILRSFYWHSLQNEF